MSKATTKLARTRDFLGGWLRRYIRGYYSPGDPEVHRAIVGKEEHTDYVRRNCAALARHLRLPVREALCAEIAGILHDVGRFEQFARYRTFNDGHSVNHAALALDIIDGKRLLTRIPAEDRRRIRFAIERHNQRVVGYSDDDTALAYAKILRDADKLDIYRVLEPFLTPPQNNLSDEFLRCFVKGEQVNYYCVRSVDDLKLVRLMWLYDVNYSWTLRRIVERGYIEKIVRGIPSSAAVNAGVRRLKDYVHQRLEEETDHGDDQDG